MKAGAKSGEEMAVEGEHGMTAKVVMEEDMEMPSVCGMDATYNRQVDLKETEEVKVGEAEEAEEIGFGIFLLTETLATVEAIAAIFGGGRVRGENPMRGVFPDLIDI